MNRSRTGCAASWEGNPTDAQIEAIDLAINSRDIVLIQGPPGTGKTRVIAAIQARLTELYKDAPALGRRVLLTSYQHDAVANLVLAADDGNLPPVKLGRAEGEDDEAFLVAWTRDLQARLAKRYENARPNEAVRARRALADRANAYRQQPFDVGSTVDLLEWLSLQLNLVGSEVVYEARRLAKRLAREFGTTTNSRSQAVAMVSRDGSGRRRGVRRRRCAHSQGGLPGAGGLRSPERQRAARPGSCRAWPGPRGCRRGSARDQAKSA